MQLQSVEKRSHFDFTPTSREKDVTVPSFHDAVPMVDEDDSDLVFASLSVAPTPQRGAPPCHGGVRLRRKGPPF